MHMRVVEFRLPKKYKIHGGTPPHFVVFNFGATFVFPVLCRISDTPKGITYRAERPPFFVFEFWSTSEYPYSAKIPSKSVRCSVDFQCLYIYIYTHILCYFWDTFWALCVGLFRYFGVTFLKCLSDTIL